MKVPMPLPLPLMVPAAYYYYHHHHQHQHLLHSSSYSSCPAMFKCVAGTWIRPRVCEPMAQSKARKAFRVNPAVACWASRNWSSLQITTDSSGSHADCSSTRLSRNASLRGLDASSLTWTGLDCAALCGGDKWWGEGRGARLKRSVSPPPLPAFPICHFEDKDSLTKCCPSTSVPPSTRGKVQILREKTKLFSLSVLLLSLPSTQHCPLLVGWSYDVGLRTPAITRTVFERLLFGVSN